MIYELLDVPRDDAIILEEAVSFMHRLKKCLLVHNIIVLPDMDGPTGIAVIDKQNRILVAKTLSIEIDKYDIENSAIKTAAGIRAMHPIAVAFYRLYQCHAVNFYNHKQNIDEIKSVYTGSAISFAIIEATDKPNAI